MNQTKVEAINSNLLENIRDDSLDILLFNPPYVPSDEDELGSISIEAAWAGGANGRVIIDRLIPDVKVIL
jgi:release factor glutamine methyltransferase